MRIQFGAVPVDQIKRGAVLTDEETGTLEFPVLTDAAVGIDTVESDDTFGFIQIMPDGKPHKTANRGFSTVTTQEPGQQAVSFILASRWQNGMFMPDYRANALKPGQTEVSGFNLKTPAPDGGAPTRFSPLPDLTLDDPGIIFPSPEKAQPEADQPDSLWKRLLSYIRTL
jgi:hypothetical protein